MYIGLLSPYFITWCYNSDDIASEGTPMICSSSLNGIGSPDMGKQGKQAPMLHGNNLDWL